MRVLVTGGAGFIGSHIVDALIEQGHEVSIIDNLSTGNIKQVASQADFFQIDIADPQISAIFKQVRPEVVIHHAAQIDIQTSTTFPLLDAQINIMGTLALLEQCKLHDVRKIIYASSAAVYGTPNYLPVDEQHRINPLSFYGISKYTPESYIRLYADIYHLDYTILRYSNVYGIRQESKGEGGVIRIFLEKLLHGIAPTILGDGNQTRDFIYVKDIVAANLAALNLGSRAQYNISNNDQISINSLIQKLNALMNLQLKPLYAPARIGDIKHSRLSNELARLELAWQPVYSIDQGLRETFHYYQSQRL